MGSKWVGVLYPVELRFLALLPSHLHRRPRVQLRLGFDHSCEGGWIRTNNLSLENRRVCGLL